MVYYSVKKALFGFPHSRTSPEAPEKMKADEVVKWVGRQVAKQRGRPSG